MKISENPEIFVDYVPAQLHEGKRWYVSYYVLHPDTGKMVRKQMKVNRIQNLKDRRKWAKKLVAELNSRLVNGWNPFLAEMAPRAYTKLLDVFHTFLAEKKREVRPDSYRSYKSNIDILTAWLISKQEAEIYTINFTKLFAKNYMSYAYIDRKVAERSYNNYLRFCCLLWNWLIENQYCRENVFTHIIKKKVKPKNREQFIGNDTRNRIKAYLQETDKAFLTVCLLAYHCLLRPKEISHLKAKYFNFQEQSITIPGTITKNGKARTITIPDVLLNQLIQHGQDIADPELYLFSDNFRPGKIWKGPRTISKRWDRLRKQITLEMSYQFYSLRDTGIIQKLKDGISPDEVMYQADHSSLETTNKYVKIANPGVNKAIKEKSSSF